ncbi:MAG: hypothetical protein HY673_09820 [Chloroflexi bacterium]|nr:hypothetical protein [Chloroflexota bacterium]
MLARKAFHLIGGMIGPVGAVFLPREAVLWGLGIAGAVAMIIEIIRFVSPSCNACFVAIGGPMLRRQETSHVTGSTYLLISSFLTFLVFPREVAAVAVSFLAVGDAVGAVVGVAFATGTRPEKNWQGRIACFSSALLVGLVVGSVVLDMNVFVVLVGAATAAVVETLTLPVNDNITIPVSSAVAMTLLNYFL